MSIKHVEAGRQGGRPRFNRYPQGTPGVLTKGGHTTKYVLATHSPGGTNCPSSKKSARESLLLIISD